MRTLGRPGDPDPLEAAGKVKPPDDGDPVSWVHARPPVEIPAEFAPGRRDRERLQLAMELQTNACCSD